MLKTCQNLQLLFSFEPNFKTAWSIKRTFHVSKYCFYNLRQENGFLWTVLCVCVYIQTHKLYIYIHSGYKKKKGEISKVNKKFISHLTRSQRTPSATATVQVSHALPAVRFSCLLRSQFPRWRRSRKRLSVCSVLRCPDLWLQWKKLTLRCNHRSGNLKIEHTESLFLLQRHLGN